MKRIRLIVLLLCPVVSIFAQDSDTIWVELNSCVHLDEVEVSGVTGTISSRESAAPVSVVSNVALRSHSATNIIDAITRQPGVDQVTTGSGISKPVIRGLGYNRVLVVNDGLRQEGQQWGDEHGVEIDEQSVHSVEIIKGPASLMYGSDAMAGVVVMRSAPVLKVDSMRGEVGTGYQTNNGLLHYTVDFQGNKKGFVWDGRWSQRWAHDYKAPLDGYVANSRFREKAFSGMMGLQKRWGYSHLRLGYYHLTPGMTEVEDSYEEGSRSYAVAAPFQEVRHYKASLDNRFYLPKGNIDFIVGYQQNRRQEFEEEDACGLDFRLHTLNYDLRYVSPSWRGWKCNFGVAGMWQSSENLGDEFLIPAYHLNDIGLYATTTHTFGDRFHLSGGFRFDHRDLFGEELEEEGEALFTEFERRFNAFSGSVGCVFNLNEHMDLRANLSHGFRAPNMSELASNGVHEGTFRYELGNHQLNPEKSWQMDLGCEYASEYISLALALFANRISDYIYLQKQDLEMDELPLFQYTAGDARLLGGEARVILHLFHHLHFENNFSYVNAQLLDSDKDSRYLPFTPAPKLLSTLHYDIPVKTQWLRHFYAEAEGEIHFPQNHIMVVNGTERPSSSYGLLHLNVGGDIHLRKGRKLCSITVNGTNLLNQAYQSHLSRLKYAETLPFTGREGINNMGRNIGLKVVFPIEMNAKTVY